MFKYILISILYWVSIFNSLANTQIEINIPQGCSVALLRMLGMNVGEIFLDENINHSSDIGENVDDEFKRAMVLMCQRLKSGDRRISIEILRKLSREGHLNSKFTLTIYELLGDHISKNVNNGLLRMEELMSDGYGLAAAHFAAMSVRSDVGEVDYKKAAEYYEKAIRLGEVHSYFYLGMLYEKGYLGKRNIIKAKELYLLGSKKGGRDSSWRLFHFFDDNSLQKGLNLNAQKYLDISINQGHYIARFYKGHLHRLKSTEADKIKSSKMFKVGVCKDWYGVAMAQILEDIASDQSKPRDLTLLRALIIAVLKSGFLPSTEIDVQLFKDNLKIFEGLIKVESQKVNEKNDIDAWKKIHHLFYIKKFCSQSVIE